MGSDPNLAEAAHGDVFIDLAATALLEDLQRFMADGEGTGST
jgi:hypothetical protein